MRSRAERKRRPILDGLESRLAPSALTPGSGPPQEVRHDDGRDHDDKDGDGGDRQDNGSWEPKPIGNSSTRPTIPSGPTGPVR